MRGWDALHEISDDVDRSQWRMRSIATAHAHTELTQLCWDVPTHICQASYSVEQYTAYVVHHSKGRSAQ